jgi:hypothetical protein
MRKVLILAAVDDETIGFEVEVFHEVLHSGI